MIKKEAPFLLMKNKFSIDVIASKYMGIYEK